jgi:hypothetical protein
MIGEPNEPQGALPDDGSLIPDQQLYRPVVIATSILNITCD